MRSTFLVMLGALSACHEPTPLRQEPVAAAPFVDAAPVVVTSADAAPPLPAQPAGCPRFAPALARARAATKSAHYKEALDAFDEALRARPFDARAWAERGYAEQRSGADPRDSYAAARSLTKDPVLIATIWMNEADTDERDHDDVAARLHYAISSAMGYAAATAKLGTRSRCTATWSTTKLTPMPFVQGWRAVLDAEPPGACAEAREAKSTDTAARAEACRGCNSLTDPLDHNTCAGPGPWTIGNGYMSCHVFSIFIQDLGQNRFVVADSDPSYEKITGGFRQITHADPRHGRAIAPVPWEQMAGQPDDHGCVPDITADVDLEMPQHCQMGEAIPPVDGPTLVHFWDERGRARLDVTAWTGTPQVTFNGQSAVIAGEGCSETIALP